MALLENQENTTPSHSWQRYNGAPLLLAPALALTTQIPLWLHHSAGNWQWPALSALAALTLLGRAKTSETLTIFLTSIAINLDFLRYPPHLILAVCQNAALAELWQVQWRSFPISSLTMLACTAACIARPSSHSRWLHLVSAAAMALLMLSSMVLGMEAFKLLAQFTGLSWGADGMVSSMLVSMSIGLVVVKRE